MLNDIDLDLELAFGADLAADPSGWVWTSMADPAGDGSEPTRIQSQALNISRGRQDETSQSQPASLTAILDNLDGALSPRNPMSPWWPNVRRGVPMRATIAGVRSTLYAAPGANPSASTPDHASLDITGDIDLRWDGTVGTWAADQILIFKSASPGDQRSYALRIHPTAGRLALVWSPDGTLAAQETILSTATPNDGVGGARLAVRATLDVNDGAGGHVARFYTAPHIGGRWEPLGDPVTVAGTTSIHVGTADLQVWDGDALSAEVRNGIDGTLVAAPNFAAQPAGTTTFDDDLGRTWTVNVGADASISDTPTIRFVGTVAAINPDWPHGDNSTDTDPAEAHAIYTAAGPLRRLARNDAPVESLLRRAIPTLPVVAYWPLEDPSTARAAASAIEGAPSATVNGGTFASATVAPGSDPVVSSNASLLGINGTVPTATAGAWSTSYLYLPDGQASEIVTLWVHTTGTARLFAITINAPSGLIGIDAFNASGTFIDGASWGVGADVFAGPTWLHFDAAQDGGNVDVGWQIENVDGPAGGAADTFAGVTCGRITRVQLLAASAEGWGFGHLFTTAGPLSAVTGLPAGGYAGELGSARLQRLADEAGIALDLTAGDSTPMGPQPTAQVLDVMLEVATADLGVLSEQVDGIGLAYRPRASLYSQGPRLVLDARTDIVPPLEPSHDDQRLVNEVALTQANGPTVRITDHASQTDEGVYDTAATINVQHAHQLPDAAAWRLWLGSFDGYRFPTVTLDLTILTAAQRAAFCDLRQGDPIRLEHLPTPLGDLDLLVEGWKEAITSATWVAELACSPAEPWQVAILEDTTWGRLDSDASTLDADIDDNDTTLDVAVEAGHLLWSHADGDFDICIGGEAMTVTAIAGASSPQTFTVTRAVNGVAKAHTAGAEVRLAHPMVIAW